MSQSQPDDIKAVAAIRKALAPYDPFEKDRILQFVHRKVQQEAAEHCMIQQACAERRHLIPSDIN